MAALLVLVLLSILYAIYELYCMMSSYLSINKSPKTHQRLPPRQITLWHSFAFWMQRLNYYIHLLTSLYHLALLHLGVGVCNNEKEVCEHTDAGASSFSDTSDEQTHLSLASVWDGLKDRLGLRLDGVGRKRAVTDDMVTGFILNSAFTLWLTSEQEFNSERSIETHRVTVSLTGFRFMLFPETENHRLDVEFSASIDVKSRLPLDQTPIEKFEFNGIQITDNRERLNLLNMLAGSVLHPIIHAHNNRTYAYVNKYPEYDELFIHSQYLNWAAHTGTGVCFVRDSNARYWMKETLVFNADLPIPHHNFGSLFKLKPFSRYIRFLLPARDVVFRVCKEHEVKIDCEAFFLTSVLHAVDHHLMEQFTRGVFLENKVLPNTGWFNLAPLLFYRPSQYIFTNLLKVKQHKNPFYAALYEGLEPFDKELADIVTLSISY